MARDLGRLRIERLIVHEIPRRMAGATGALALSQIDSPLTQELKNYFKEKISGSLTSAHLAYLRRYGVVAPRKDGQRVYYRLTYPELIGPLRAVIDAVAAQMRSG